MRSTRYAVILASGYALLAGGYIVFSSSIAAHASASVEDLRRIEVVKGVVFVAVTAAAVFFGAWAALSRLERADAELLRRDHALLANERRIFAGLMAASTAHDANNVLVGVIGDLHELSGALGGGHPQLHRLRTAVERLIALNRRLLSTVRQGTASTLQDLDLAREVEETVSALRSHRELRERNLRLRTGGECRMRTHPLLVHQILTNLVVNAGEATREGGTVEVRLERRGGEATIEVHDDGPGVPAARREGLFDALETTKADGSGLGLFSVKACASALGGAVAVEDSPLGGACFRVRLPIAPGA